MADKLEVKGVPDRWHEELDLEVKKYEWVDASYIGQGYQTSHISLDIIGSSLHILQGNVVYEMSMREVLDIFRFAIGKGYDKTIRYLQTNFYLNGFIWVPNGTFVPHPSRERLTFDDMTKEGLKNIFSKVFQHFIYDDINLILGSVKTYYELYLAVREKTRLIKNAPQIMDFIVEDQDTSIFKTSIGKPIKNFNDWCKTMFSCIAIVEISSGRYQFKRASQFMMFGCTVGRIYFTSKYPLSRSYRYRLIKDMQETETVMAIILNGWDCGYLFQPSDKSRFVDVQALPKLTQADWAKFKHVIQGTATVNRVRVTKKEVSFVTVSSYISLTDIHQKTTEEVIDIASKMHVMWVGSNRRYEISIGRCTYKLKRKEGLKTLTRSLSFYFNSVKNMISNWKEKGVIKFGIVVLPDGHPLRGLLPELTEKLRLAALFEIREFLKVPCFQIEHNSRDLFMEYLKKNPMVFDELLEGWEGRASFDRWRINGMPKGSDYIEKPDIPFLLWDDSDVEMKEAKIIYDEEQNCVKVDVRAFYDRIFKRFPLFRYSFLWSGITNPDAAKDMIEYVGFKLCINISHSIQ
jgi:hypothetical protein